MSLDEILQILVIVVAVGSSYAWGFRDGKSFERSRCMKPFLEREMDRERNLFSETDRWQNLDS